MRSRWLGLAVMLLGLGAVGGASPATPRFLVSFPAAAHASPVTGRLVVVVSKSAQPEPRMLVSPSGPAIFGLDLDQLMPGQQVVVDRGAASYPVSLDSLPAGDYYVQAVVDVYSQLRRADGHTIWVHMNDGRIEPFQIAAGNLYSDVQKVHLGAESDGAITITVTHAIPEQPEEEDTEWLKHVRIQSDLLTHFWGRPIFVHATVLLPKGYTDHPSVHYPSVYTLGHGTPFQFSTTPGRTTGTINPATGTESGYDFYRQWVSDSMPRVIAISLEQQTPYFPDSYSVNSANNGPYGDAIVREVMPSLERQFRIIPKSSARILEGASTSGWQTLAMMLQHPDDFGGAWVLQPDPIDFRHYQQTNIYADTNAFTLGAGQFTAIERPFRRTTQGQVVWTTRQLSRFENVLGSHGRSGYQLEAWEAVYGPVADDGYPRPLWNKVTGTIDHDVASYMREHGYDLREYASRNWETIGPKLAGKLHFFAGDMDDFYLNLAVYDFQDFLKGTTDPHSDAQFTFGRPMKGHSWHNWTWAGFVQEVGTYLKGRVEEKDWLY
jgi:putative esterase